MRFTTLQTLTLICGASAAVVPVAERAVQDVATFTAAISSISSSLTDFDSTITAITATSDMSTVASDLSTKASTIVSAITTGTTNINGSPALSLADTLQLVNPASALGTTANTTLTDLIGKHDILVNGGQQSLIVSLITSVKTAAVPFEDAVVSKVPDSLKSTAQSLGNQVITALNNAIVAYGGTV